MPFFGNNGFGVAPSYLSDELYGHFDPIGMVAWGMPIPACIVKTIYIYAQGSAVAETATLRFGIYDASSGTPPTYTLVAQAGNVSIASAAPGQWWSLPVSIPLVAGTYCLSVLDVNGPAMTWSAGIYFTVKLIGPSYKSFVGGVFPNPLGAGVVSTNQDWSMYADYVLPGVAYTPTAACYSQPKCGEG